MLDNILFLTFYTGLLLLSRKKTGGALNYGTESKMEGGDEKAIYLIRESFDDSVCKRGIASAVSFQKEVFLLTSSSVVKEVKPNEKPKKLIAQRFSRRKFGAYQAEVSIYRTIDEFTFLKIDKECEFSNVDKGWSTSHRNFDVSAPSSETKALATSPFCESLRQQVKPVAFECNGNNTIIEVIPETPIERTSILGAPIFLETKTTYTMKGDKFKVIGVVGLSSEEKLCSYYLNHNILGEICLVCVHTHLVGLIFSKLKFLSAQPSVRCAA